MNDTDAITGWCIVELMGHQKIAGYALTSVLGGTCMLRMEIPEVDGAPAYTRWYGLSAIYSLTLVTEEIALAALKSIRPAAVTVYIPQLAERASPPTYDDVVARHLVDESEDEEDTDFPF
jgi:hypothetical protein